PVPIAASRKPALPIVSSMRLAPNSEWSSYFACACLNAPAAPSALLALVVVLKAKDLIKLGMYRLTLCTLLSCWHWHVHLHTNVNASLRVPSMQLHCAAYHVFQPRRRVHHIIVPQFAPQRGDDAQSEWSLGLRCARDCRTRDHRSLAPLHAPFHGRSAQRHAAVAGRDRPL